MVTVFGLLFTVYCFRFTLLFKPYELYYLITRNCFNQSTLPNNYFQFKQFTIHQDKCAMKVCTDTCLLGAVVADTIENNKITVENILDIGCGTGLLSLMLAQKINTEIDAVEIDTAAYQQAAKNFEDSPWKERLAIFNNDILEFCTNKIYGCIISNPPFFEGSLKSSNSKKNTAKHDTALILEQLLNVVKDHLKPDGFFSVLLPYYRLDYFIKESKKIGLFLSQKILVKQTAGHAYFRGILFFRRQQTDIINEEIIIKNETGNYTGPFTLLLKDYYLYM